MIRYWSSLLLMLCFVSIVVAQADCPALVDAAFAATNESCADLGRNQACYGNILLNATPRADVSDFTFEQTGDVLPVEDIDSLQLSSMSLTDETWGIALMLLQANLPDTLPGQNVTVLMFGDVEIANAVDELVELSATASANVNIRLRPTTSENNVIATLSRGANVIANGRLEDGSWIRILLSTDLREIGWVSADFLTSDEDLNTLTVVEGGSPLYAPMQAFYFASSIGDSQCAEAPDSGILIQTPQGAGEVLLSVNEVDIRLGSTIFMTAGNGVMTISVVEGHANVTAGGVSQTVPAGTFTEIPLNANGLASGTPSYPQPYNLTAMQALPVSVALPQSVTVAPPLPASEISAEIDTADGLPLNGEWANTELVLENTCDPSTIPVGQVSTAYFIFSFSLDRSSFTFDAYNGQILTFTRTAENVYMTSTNPSDIWTITFHSATTYTSTYRAVYGDPTQGGCIYSQDATGLYVGS